MSGGGRLSRKLLLSLAATLGLTSLAFLTLFISSYRVRISSERANASDQVNRLLHVALENAMLKRDLPGLQDILNRLGEQPGIASVAITDPTLIVRFSSEKIPLNSKLLVADIGCPGCEPQNILSMQPQTFPHVVAGREVLRSVKPIQNRDACRECHGPTDAHPINGILVVDHEVGGLKRDALLAAGALSGAGLAVVLIGLLSHWYFLRRLVLAPIASLDRASQSLAAGDLSGRVDLRSSRNDEMHDLATSFNRMAERIDRNVHDIKEQERFLRALMDTVPDGVRVIDEHKKVILANASLARQVGARVDELIGQPCFALHGRDSPCPPTLITCPFHALRSDAEPIRYVHRHMKIDGSDLHVETTAARVTVERGGSQRTFIVEAIRDLDQQIRYSHEQRLAEIGQLAAGVAHEIYNPLASVQIALQAFLSAPPSEWNDTEAKTYINAIETELHKCIAVAKRLLDLSQVPSSSVQLVSVSTIVPEVLSLLSYEAEQRKVKVSLELGATPLRVFATDPELRMVVLNLVQNAFHAMPNGGDLQVEGRTSGNTVELAIRDSGVGIEPERMTQIFDPFHSRRADGVSGTGLGLTISQAIAHRYGGQIGVTSTVGVGSTFTVTFPSADAEVPRT